MKINNEEKLKNLVITLRVVATFTTTTNKNIKRKLKVSKLTKIVTSFDINVASIKSVIKQLNKKSRSKNSLFSCLVLKSQSSVSEATKASAKIALSQETKITSTQKTTIKEKL